MKKITIKNIKNIDKSSYSENHPVSLHEFFQELNTQCIATAPENNPHTFNKDCIKWLRTKNSHGAQQKLNDNIYKKLQSKYHSISPDKLKQFVHDTLNSDLNSASFLFLTSKLNIDIPFSEFSQLLSTAIHEVVLKGYGKYFQETVRYYNPEVTRIGQHLINVALAYSRDETLINWCKPEVMLTLRHGRVVLLCVYKGPIGVEKLDQPSTYELIPLRHPIKIEVYWQPKLGWTFALINETQNQEDYQRLGVLAIVMTHSYKKEKLGGAFGLLFGLFGYFLMKEVVSETQIVLAVGLLSAGILAMVISGVSSCLKNRHVGEIDYANDN